MTNGDLGAKPCQARIKERLRVPESTTSGSAETPEPRHRSEPEVKDPLPQHSNANDSPQCENCLHTDSYTSAEIEREHQGQRSIHSAIRYDQYEGGTLAEH